jgi:hypothetical protein
VEPTLNLAGVAAAEAIARQIGAELEAAKQKALDFYEEFEAPAISGLGAETASSLLTELTTGVTKILKGGVHGAEIGLNALKSAGNFVKKNAGKFMRVLSDFGTFAEAGLAIAVGSTSCVAGAVGASVTAPFAAPFVWFGCGSFTIGNGALMGYSALDVWETFHGH